MFIVRRQSVNAYCMHTFEISLDTYGRKQPSLTMDLTIENENNEAHDDPQQRTVQKL